MARVHGPGLIGRRDLLAALFGMGLVHSVEAAPLSPYSAPGENFDLSVWKLTLPIDSAGGKTLGQAAEINPIPPTYQAAPYFYTAADGGMVFMAPTDGATTSGSRYPRSELRELDAAGREIAWTTAIGGSLTATLAVNALPKVNGVDGAIVIGQVHGPNDELCRLTYAAGKLTFSNDKSGAALTEQKFTLKDSAGRAAQVPLNRRFDYIIRVNDTHVSVIVRYQGILYRASDRVRSFWTGKPLYFKAGTYVQAGIAASGAGTVGTGQGQATFYALARPVHPYD